MIKTTCTCDDCNKEIDGEFMITLSSVLYTMNLRLDFCGKDCFENWFVNKWKEDEEWMVE